MQRQLKWLIPGGLVVATVGLSLGYDEALAALLAPLLGLRQHRERAKQAQTEGHRYREISATRMNGSQADNTEADDFHEQQEAVAEDPAATETMPVNEGVDDAKKDWD